MNGEQKRGSRAGEMYAAGLLLSYAVILFAHHGAPSLTDYANWTYQGVLLRDHLLGRPDAAHVLKRYPVPNGAVTVGIGVLALVLPWMIAAKVWLCLQLGVSWLALRHLLRTVGGGAAAWVVVPQAVFLNVNLWYGFVNFQLGICWVMLMASLLLQRVRGGGGKDWVIGGLLLVAFFTHMIPFAFCGLLVLLYAAQTERWRVLWQSMPSAVLSVWYLVGRFLMAGNADGRAGMVATAQDYSVAFWVFKGNSYLKSFGLVNPMGMDRSVFWQWGVWVLMGVDALLAGVAGWATIRAMRDGLRTGAEARFIWIALAVLVPVFVLAPGTALGVSDPGARVLQVGLSIGLMLCWKYAGKWGKRVGMGSAVVLAGAGLWLFLLCGGETQLTGKGSGAPGRMNVSRIPNDDQDYFYAALTNGEMRLPVFPTGMFLNRK